jgi:hypothetical protein
MADYGILVAAREALRESEAIVAAGVQDSVHLAVPPESDLPIILLELEEIWTSMRLGEKNAHVRVKFKTSILSDSPTGRDAINIADAVRRAIDGQTMGVQKGMTATIKLAGSVIDLPAPSKPRSVQQYYEAIIRG